MIKDGSVIRTELALWAGIITTLLFLVFGDRWVADLSNLLWYSLLFVWLFVVIAWLAFSVVRGTTLNGQLVATELHVVHRSCEELGRVDARRGS